MQFDHLNMRLVKLPPKIEFLLSIIKEDLKNTKLFQGLERADLAGDCFYRSDLSALVLGSMGFDEIPDDLQEFYGDLVSKYAEMIEPDNRVIMEHAFEVYSEILIEKKKRFAE